MTQHTPHIAQAWRPDITEYVAGDVIPDALMLQTSLVVGQVEGDAPAVRVPWVSNDGSPGFVAEGQQIPDAAQDLSEVVVQTAKIATLGSYSYEVLAQPEAARLVTESLSRAVATSANAAYLGTPIGGTGPTGLLNQPIADGGIITGSLDAVVDAVANIEADGGTATHVIAGPDSWAALAKLKKDANSNESLVGAGTAAPQRLLMGLPVLVSRSMPAGGVIVMDKTAVISAQSPLRLARSEDAMFSYDVVAIRLAWRIGWSVQRPDRVVKLSTLAPLAAPTKRSSAK